MSLICCLPSHLLYYLVSGSDWRERDKICCVSHFQSRSLAGNIRRFRRICEHIQSQVCSKRFPGPGSPPRVTSVTNAVSESSSCGSDSSERLSCYKRQVSESSSTIRSFPLTGYTEYNFFPIFEYRLKLMVKTIQYLSAIKRMWHVVHRLRQTIIIKCSVSRAVQKPFDRGKGSCSAWRLNTDTVTF